MERVLGLGGIFLRATDPGALSQWYQQHLGLDIQPEWNGAKFSLRDPKDKGGAYTVWSAFPPDTSYLGEGAKFMVNFRVADLSAMLAQLRAAGPQHRSTRGAGGRGVAADGWREA